MVKIDKNLIYKHLTDQLLKDAWNLLENDIEIQSMIDSVNIMISHRLRYNDHGIVHSRIVAGTALEIFNLLENRGVEFSSIKDGIVENKTEAKLIILFGSYLHDIGNAIHRINHELIGALVSKNIVYRLMKKLGIEGSKAVKLTTEIMHSIYSTNINIPALTTEASIVKIADALDMSEGRARIAYEMGKIDIHATSALSIKRVEIENGERPLKIVVYMDSYAGLFQIERLVIPKIEHSILKNETEIYMSLDDKLEKVYPK